MSLAVIDGNGTPQSIKTKTLGSDLATVSFNESEILYENFTPSLADGSSIQTSYIDFKTVDRYEIYFKGDATGLTFQQESYDDSSQTVLTTSQTYSESTLFRAKFPPRQNFIRFTVTNNTGSAVTNVSLVIKASYGSSEGASVFPLSIQPQNFSGALLTRSVLSGQKPGEGTGFSNVQVNEIGALLTSDFATEVARGFFPTYKADTKFGRNAVINIADGQEDMWNGGSLYTGHNCTQAELLSIVSSDVNDVGSLVDSGTATGGTTTTLVDSGATFVTTGVAVGDMVINDTKQFHGIISSLTETEVTVYFWKDGVVDTSFTFESGDVYRIATATNTGAAVIKLSAALDSNYDEITEYVILNGTTSVLTTKSFIRQSRGTIELAGSTGYNEGEITARQSVTTANVTMVMPSDSGQTAICCSTVPRGKRWIIKHLQCSIVRDSGASGSAQLQFQVRERGGAWQTKRFEGVSSSLAYNEKIDGGIVIEEQSDVKWRIQSVSDNSTQATGLFSFFEIDK